MGKRVDRSRASPARRALAITLGYAAVGVAWILLSDAALRALASDPDVLTVLQTLKGWSFVVLSALALFLLLRWQFWRDARMLERSRAQRSEIAALSQFREGIIESAQVWINSVDPDARVTLWNRAAEQISGYRRDEVLGRSDVWEWLYPDPEYRAYVTRTASEVLLAGRELEDFETSIVSRDGSRKIIAWDAGRLYDEAGQIIGSVAIGCDITATKLAEQALRARERELATLLSNLPGMAYRCLDDEHWTMKFVSSGCRELTGYEPEEVIDNRLTSFQSIILPEDRKQVADTVHERIAQGQAFAVEYRVRRRDGGVVWIWEQGRAVTLEGQPYLEGILFDITQRKSMEQEMERLATRDQLTGLYNRRELDRRLRSELARSQRYGRPVSVLWLDLDNFKEINDRFGHLAGDRVLQQVSEQLTANVRSIDCVARYGGEELVVVLPEMSQTDAVEIAERLRSLLAETPLRVAPGESAAVTTSIGIATAPDHGTTAEGLYSAADDAMYRAKHDGRNLVRSASR